MKAKKQQKPVVKKFQEYFYYFMLTAFIGYIYEFLLITFYYGEAFVNQGPLHGPWLFIYGLGGLLIIAALKKYLHKKVMIGKINVMPIIMAMMIFAIVAVVEYLGHWIADTLFGWKPWDYSEKFMNLNGRICLEDSLRFVILGLVGMYAVVPFTEKLFARITKKQNMALFWILATTIGVDAIVSAVLLVL